jgi:tetrapyrrole methylase family protein/MazG family protein
LEETLNHTSPPFKEIIDLIETLRSENGCPWDRKQTPLSMARYLVEEAFELMDAVHSNKAEAVCEELGDVLFLVLFIAVQFQTSGLFSINTLIRRNLEKMTRRHPHVFAAETAHTPEQVRERWHEIKRREKSPEQNPGILGNVPKSLPALLRAHRISERAAQSGFDWDSVGEVMIKVQEEWSELKQELKKNREDSGNSAALEMEIGDVLFTLVNVARFAGIHSETALAASTRKFEARFNTMEKLARERQGAFEKLSFEDKHRLWDEVKKSEKKESC